jgi:hypothetical protein
MCGVIRLCNDNAEAVSPAPRSVRACRYRDSNNYNHWWGQKGAFIALPLQATVAEVIATLKEYPPRKKPGLFNVDLVLEQLQKNSFKGN